LRSEGGLGWLGEGLGVAWVMAWSCGVDPMTINIEWQDQNGYWRHFQTKQNEAEAYRVAQRRAKTTKKRHSLVDNDGRLIDLLEK
jgi:hypothetical protein